MTRRRPIVTILPKPGDVAPRASRTVVRHRRTRPAVVTTVRPVKRVRNVIGRAIYKPGTALTTRRVRTGVKVGGAAAGWMVVGPPLGMYAAQHWGLWVALVLVVLVAAKFIALAAFHILRELFGGLIDLFIGDGTSTSGATTGGSCPGMHCACCPGR